MKRSGMAGGRVVWFADVEGVGVGPEGVMCEE